MVLGCWLLAAPAAADVLAGLSASGEAPAGSGARTYREGNAWVQEITGTLPAAKTIRVSTDSGSVRVSGAAQQNITYTLRKKVYTSSEEAAKRRFQQFKISAWTTGDAATFRGQCETTEGRTAVDFDIKTPREVNLVYVRTEGGSVTTSGVTGRVDLQTAGGSITMDDIGGAVLAETYGGSIDVGTAGGDVQVTTSGGSIRVRQGGRIEAQTSGGSIEIGVSKQAIVAQTAGGGIRVGQSGGDLRAETAGGSIDVGEVNGAAVLSTAGGSIKLGSAKGLVQADTAGGQITLYRLAGGARAQTAAGGIFVEFIGGRGGFSDSRFETTAGDIVVVLPSNLGVTVRAAIELATGHKIRSEFPELKVTSEGGEHGPKEIFGEGLLNGGGPLLKAHTTIGNIEFRKGK